jgi:hypothetical protein
MNRLYLQQENFRTVNNTYTNNLPALGFAGGCTANCVYDISFDVAPTTQTYTARFVPNPGGGTNGVDQTRDDDCSWFTIDALNAAPPKTRAASKAADFQPFLARPT